MKVSLVIPVLDEEAAIDPFLKAVHDDPGLETLDLEIVFVNDGSQDRTRQILSESKIRGNKKITILHLSRNFGKEAALMAGLHYSTGEVVIPFDVDLQDPLSLIPDMIAEYRRGFDVVLPRSIFRGGASASAEVQSRFFHSFFSFLTGSPGSKSVGDFRLMSRRVVDQIIRLEESDLYMKSVMNWVGYSVTHIDYVRRQRLHGATKFKLRTKIKLGLSGLIASTAAPLRAVFWAGLLVALLSIGFGSALLVVTLVEGNPVPGLPTLMVSILFLGGINLAGLGILGEYVHRILTETKRRPAFVVESIEHPRGRG